MKSSRLPVVCGNVCTGRGYVYTVRPPYGIDVNAVMGPHPYASELEIAVPGGIRLEASWVRGRSVHPVSSRARSFEIRALNHDGRESEVADAVGRRVVRRRAVSFSRVPHGV